MRGVRTAAHRPAAPTRAPRTLRLRIAAQRAASAGCFVFQAEDGIRDYKVTGVQTCALPIFLSDCERDRRKVTLRRLGWPTVHFAFNGSSTNVYVGVNFSWPFVNLSGPYVCVREIGRASCRERV